MRAEFMRRLGGGAVVMALCVALALITCAILLRVGRGAYADLQGAQGQQGDSASSAFTLASAHALARQALGRTDVIDVPTRGRVCSAEESARNERALLAPPAGKTASEAGYHECLHRQPAVDASVKDAPPRFVAYKRCPISFKTRCPKADWVDDMFAMERESPMGKSERAIANGGMATTSAAAIDSQPPVTTPRNFTIVSVGCNKAFDAISLLRQVTGDPAFDRHSWREALFGPEEAWRKDKNGRYLHRGACGQASPNSPEWRVADASTLHRRAQLFCIEPMPSTFEALSAASRKLGLEQRGLVLSNLAIAASNGVTRFPGGAEVGMENIAIDECGSGKKKNMDMHCVSVNVRSLDDYMATKILGGDGEHAGAGLRAQIDMLQIDAEGFDAEVLAGGTAALTATRYLEFEFHGVGKWITTPLEPIIAKLDALGFDCYWAGRGQLWRITGCFVPSFEFHFWANVACVKRSDHWHAVMERYAALPDDKEDRGRRRRETM